MPLRSLELDAPRDLDWGDVMPDESAPSMGPRRHRRNRARAENAKAYTFVRTEPCRGRPR